MHMAWVRLNARALASSAARASVSCMLACRASASALAAAAACSPPARSCAPRAAASPAAHSAACFAATSAAAAARLVAIRALSISVSRCRTSRAAWAAAAVAAPRAYFGRSTQIGPDRSTPIHPRRPLTLTQHSMHGPGNPNEHSGW